MLMEAYRLGLKVLDEGIHNQYRPMWSFEFSKSWYTCHRQLLWPKEAVLPLVRGVGPNDQNT